MKPTFTIKRKGAQDERSVPFDKILTPEILEDICFRLTQQREYTLKWVEERNKGRLVILETDNEKYYITLSTHGDVVSRNAYFQSVPTAFSKYLDDLDDSLDLPKSRHFCFYFLPCKGNNKTRYMRFFYRVLSTVGVRFINPDKGLKGVIYSPFQTVKEIISVRNTNREKNRANHSTYITDEGKKYHIYGKTFGANDKETAMLCMAICKVSDKPVILFHITDNNSNLLSKNDISTIEKYTLIEQTQPINILDDCYEFIEQEDDTITPIQQEESLRDPRFIYNLLEKSDGHKRCALCSCEIDSIIQGAHIYPVAAIKKRKDLTYQDRLQFATDKDNGLWLCENHHKLFDRALIHFIHGKVFYNEALDNNSIAFISKITTESALSEKIYNPHMQEFFALREKVYADL